MEDRKCDTCPYQKKYESVYGEITGCENWECDQWKLIDKRMKINLNEPVKVKLTNWGKEIFYHQYDRINKMAGKEICKPEYPKEDENGYTEFQLWCFMELYGERMGMTLPNIIEPLEIVYESEKGGKNGDLISRQAAIDALNMPDYENGEAYMQYEQDANAIRNMPTAGTERRTDE